MRLLASLQNDYAQAAIVAEDDPRLVHRDGRPSRSAIPRRRAISPSQRNVEKAPAVIVIHENRGLNPHIKDVARRMALEGFVVLAPDYLSEFGGTPADEDKARDLIGQLKPERHGRSVARRGRLSRRALRRERQGRRGRLLLGRRPGRRTGRGRAEPCRGVVYYGRQPPADKVKDIQAPLLLNYAGLDTNINPGIAAFEEALKANGKTYELFMYEGANHAFNNDTNAARYNKEAADLAWGRTVAFLKKNTA